MGEPVRRFGGIFLQQRRRRRFGLRIFACQQKAAQRQEAKPDFAGEGRQQGGQLRQRLVRAVLGVKHLRIDEPGVRRVGRAPQTSRQHVARILQVAEPRGGLRQHYPCHRVARRRCQMPLQQVRGFVEPTLAQRYQGRSRRAR